jgi:NAD(P)-dependent dehydrogenase (short-subunit alcohol dehydrogenase family)
MLPRSSLRALGSVTEPHAALLTGKRAIVTAGGSGIGREIAFSLQRAGARVHVCDVSPEMLAALDARGTGLTSTIADVSDPADVDKLFSAAQATLGGLDFLINCAGIAGPTALVENIPPRDWQRTVAVNLHGSFYCSRLAVPLLKAAHGGAIISIASVAARLGYPMRSAYAASKWALIGFTQSLAMELGEFNIRVNAVLPGGVDGERMARVNRDRAVTLGISVEEAVRRDVAQVSLRRYIPVQHVAAMVLYLCSEPGSSITGQSLNVCGNVESLR